jgi:hypothetical protein
MQFRWITKARTYSHKDTVRALKAKGYSVTVTNLIAWVDVHTLEDRKAVEGVLQLQKVNYLID